VTLERGERHQSLLTGLFAVITFVFVYTTVVNVLVRPDGLKIASVFIGMIIFFSMISRAVRATELRAEEVVVDATTLRFIEEASRNGHIRIVANEPQHRTYFEYTQKEREEREHAHIPNDGPVIFFEVTVTDSSEFAPVLMVTGHSVGGYEVLRAESSSVPNAIAAFLIWVRERTGVVPDCYFAWTEGHPLLHAARFLFFGDGDVPPVTREILRGAIPNPTERPGIHVG
jgi:hypothetical protein